MGPFIHKTLLLIVQKALSRFTLHFMLSTLMFSFYLYIYICTTYFSGFILWTVVQVAVSVCFLLGGGKVHPHVCTLIHVLGQFVKQIILYNFGINA